MFPVFVHKSAQARLLALFAGVAAMALALTSWSPASARGVWCAGDPAIVVNGSVVDVNVNIPLVLAGVPAETQARAERWAEFIKRLARVSDMSSAATPPQGSAQLVVRGDLVALPLVGVIDIGAERTRLAKEMKKAEDDIDRVEKKLGNPKFVERADAEVVEEEKAKREEALARKAKIAEAIDRLKGAA